MRFPHGYGEAEHRRALDALLADLRLETQRPTPSACAPPPTPRTGAVLRLINQAGLCTIVARTGHPPRIELQPPGPCVPG